MAEPERHTFTVDADGVALGALVWGDAAAPAVVAVHGITANAWSWAPVAAQLSSRHAAPHGAPRLVAVDLRGRGASAGVRGPTGIRRHADDVAAVIERLGGNADRPVVVAGHSMGAYVALLVAERHPALVAGVVLVDGGVALPLPDGADVQAVLDATLGAAVARLRRSWRNADEYRRMWLAHPAFAGGLSPEVERYLMSDLVPAGDGTYRSCVREDAVRADGAELLLDDEVRHALDRRLAPLTMVRAETGLDAAPPPLVPAALEEQLTQHEWITVPGSNHYTVLVGGDGAAAVAAAIAAAFTRRT
jgi:pimeloyl-ACP methyl ester carboxylesterase